MEKKHPKYGGGSGKQSDGNVVRQYHFPTAIAHSVFNG